MKDSHSILPPEYRSLLENIKSKIRSAQIKAALSVNSELIRLYFEVGRSIVEKQVDSKWGDSIVKQLAIDLKNEFPNLSGFSKDNLFHMRRFYLFYQNNGELVEQLVQLIPWGHNILIIRYSDSISTAQFYLETTLKNNWSRAILNIQIESKLHERQGAAITNFEKTLPPPLSDLAQQTLKDPYIFDFLAMTEGMKELDFEKQLTDHIVSFLLELGAGFAFIGRQYPLQIGEKTYAVDLLFYHIQLRSFVVIDLKMTEFEPEFAGKMNFYLSATDEILKTEADNPSIGIILCKTKEKIEVEFALRDLNKPVGVSEWKLTHILPENLKSAFPSPEEFERELEEMLKNSKSETVKKTKPKPRKPRVLTQKPKIKTS